MIISVESKKSYLRIVSYYWVSLGLCVWIGLLCGVNATCAKLELSANSSTTLPTPAEMIKTLKTIGFSFDVEDPKVQIEPYVSTLQQEPATELNPIRTTPPMYAVTCFPAHLRFKLPEYPDLITAHVALEELRKISTIKVLFGHVIWEPNTTIFHQINLLILTRVSNILDCDTMNQCVCPSLENQDYTRLIKLGASQSEAEDAVKYAVYEKACQLELYTPRRTRLPNLEPSGVFFMRPFNRVFLRGSAVYDAHLLSQLSLTSDYSLSFAIPPKPINIDLRVLRTSSSICKEIIIDGSAGIQVTLSGLDNATAKHPEIVLKSTWEVFLYLARNNQSDIHVRAISDFSIESHSLQRMLLSSQLPYPSQLHLFSNVVVARISPILPCRALDLYKFVYSPAALAKFGIITGTVSVHYKLDRTDLYDTINMFCKINALPEIPQEIDDDITCCGTALSDPDWELKTPVLIQLDHPDFDASLKQYTDLHFVSFCENIRYTTISINGSPTGNPIKEIERCIHILSIFHNLTATEVKISNIGGVNSSNSLLDINASNQAIAQGIHNNFNVRRLVIDNVDNQIIYWLLGYYNFVGSIEVHVLNQKFTNLAIVQLLTHPMLQSITSLVINDFATLNELINYPQPPQPGQFSLFKYIEDKRQEGETILSLGLHKLALQLEGIPFDPYHEVLRKLWTYSILPLDIPLKTYLTWISIPNSTILSKSELLLSSITLTDLSNDSNHYQASLTNPFQISQLLRRSVAKLHLYFTPGQTLTQTDFTTIIRWISCRFTGLTTLYLANLQVPPNEQAQLTTQDYLLLDLTQLTTIQIQDINSEPNTYIEIAIKPHLTHLLLHTPNPQPEFTAVSHTLLTQMFTLINELKIPIPIPTALTTKSSLMAIVKHLRDNRDARESIICSLCDARLFLPADNGNTNPNNNPDGTNEDNNDNSNGEPCSKKPRLNSLLYQHIPPTTFTALCYFKCSHFACINCTTSWFNLHQEKTCPFCRAPRIDQNIHQLLNYPFTSFILNPDNPTTPSNSEAQLKLLLSPHHDQVYFYQPFTCITELSNSITPNSTYNNSQPLYLI
ncbi:hypothetical protein NEHOM01_2444 [Nematocida homosporus]|uniref:uncharacterized protein n=1 Tax=Nematocida homosporus TaxID=1912981 RepID=UPI00221F4106|nr:uncharacterized protein NEHOM01_2444 [Nematocida homosporus]KAI5187917.1 hypothetical protein NEHOM01_2444 [Nematocida homosporus]